MKKPYSKPTIKDIEIKSTKIEIKPGQSLMLHGLYMENISSDIFIITQYETGLFEITRYRELTTEINPSDFKQCPKLP